MNEAIGDLIGNLVQVRSRGGQTEYTDQGVLVSADDQWLRLDKDGEALCFPLYSVRLVKLIEWLHQPEPKDVLMRPVDGEKE
jgi:YD repeat-containing protein